MKCVIQIHVLIQKVKVKVLATESSVKERKRVECNVQVNKVKLSMYVDSLADRSILDLATFQQDFVDEAIEPPGPEDLLTSTQKTDFLL